ncbi:MAG: Uma2 family endonuclease [Acidobacteriia bacterium]|nr:Uma2 family endonuclease [Terriglobia bacterium]
MEVVIEMSTASLAAVQEYLSSCYPDGDREYLDGVIGERHMGTPEHSALQKILIVHLAAHEKQLDLAVRPECRTRIREERYRVPDLLVMQRPFRQDGRVVLDPPLLIIEILSPDDRMGETLERFREYEQLGVRHIILMDPVRRTTHLFLHGDLVSRHDLAAFEIAPGRSLPFPAAQLLALLDEE